MRLIHAKWLLLAAIVGACGAPAMQDSPAFTGTVVPGGVLPVVDQLIDGDANEVIPWSPDALYPPGADSELGEGAEGLTIADFYGEDSQSTTGSAPCYSLNHPSAACYLPKFKQVNITKTFAGCSSGVTDPAIYSACLDSFIQGVQAWNGVGGVVVAIGSGGPRVDDVTIHCEDNVTNLGTAVGVTLNLLSGQTTASGNLPVDPVRGNDLGQAIEWQHWDSGPAMGNLLSAARACYGVQNPTLAQIQGVCQHVGEHEGGHLVGYGHFALNNGAGSFNVMFPALNCQSGISPIGVQFANGLSHYSGTVQSSGATIVNDQLDALQPRN